MIRSRWFLHPVSIFISSLLALGLSLFLYIHWYLNARDALTDVVARYNVNPRQFLTIDSWVIILTLSLLVAIIMVSILLIFIYYQKMISLYRQQQNFINGFTHELKTPLTSLRLYLDTFRMHELPRQDQLKYLDLMITDVTRLGGNVESILELGKIESGPKPLNLNLINMAERAQQFINDELQHFPNVKIEFSELPPSGDLLLIKIAPKHLDVMISNIIKNAVNHNRSQSPKIDIEVRRDGRWALLRFKDNGIGIEKNEQKNIFKKFYQIGKASKGTGLGLYIVSQIAKLYDGKINVTSAGLGAGSTFEVRFPLAKAN